MLKGSTSNFKPLEILTKEQLQAIYRGILDGLEQTGIRIEHKKALELLADYGCKVDFKKNRVRISNYLVEDCIRKCPSSFTFKARKPEFDFRLGGNTLFFKQTVGSHYIEIHTWKTKPEMLEEQYNHYKNNANQIISCIIVSNHRVIR